MQHAIKRGRKKKAFFLIFSLWILLLLSVFCLGLGFRAFIETKKTRFFLNKTRAFNLALSGIKLAKKIIEEDDEGVDYLGEEWATLVEEQVKFDVPKKEGTLTITMENEGRRLNINGTDELRLERVFQAYEVDGWDEKIDYILDYIDSDSDERSHESEEDVKNEPLVVLEELMSVKNIEASDFQKIKDLFTVLGEGKVNINTVDLELLEILLDILVEQSLITEDVKDQVFEVRLGPNGIEGDDDDGYYADEAELPGQLSNFFTVQSLFFRVRSKSEVQEAKKEITCIIERNSGKILYWYEE